MLTTQVIRSGGGRFEFSKFDGNGGGWGGEGGGKHFSVEKGKGISQSGGGGLSRNGELPYYITILYYVTLAL